MAALTWKNVPAPAGGGSNTVGNIAAIKGMSDALDRMNIFKTIEQGTSDRYDTARTEEADAFQKEFDIIKRDEAQLALNTLRKQYTQDDANKAIFDMAQQYTAENPNVSEQEALDYFSKQAAGMGGDVTGITAGKGLISGGYAPTQRMTAQAGADKLRNEQAAAMELQRLKNTGMLERANALRTKKGKTPAGDKPAVSFKDTITANEAKGWGIFPTDNEQEYVITAGRYNLSEDAAKELLGQSGGNPDMFEELAAQRAAEEEYEVPTSNKAIGAKLRKDFKKSQESAAPSLFDAFRR